MLECSLSISFLRFKQPWRLIVGSIWIICVEFVLVLLHCFCCYTFLGFRGLGFMVLCLHDPFHEHKQSFYLVFASCFAMGHHFHLFGDYYFLLSSLWYYVQEEPYGFVLASDAMYSCSCASFYKWLLRYFETLVVLFTYLKCGFLFYLVAVSFP